jgi:hypothetical protein
MLVKYQDRGLNNMKIKGQWLRRQAFRVPEDYDDKSRYIDETFVTWDADGQEVDRGYSDRECLVLTYYDYVDEYGLPEEGNYEDAEQTFTDYIVYETVKFLRDKGAFYASSSEFQLDVWYHTEAAIEDYTTSNWTENSYHLNNYTEEEQRRIFERMTSPLSHFV